MSDAPQPIEIFVDADACPVKAEIYRVAERHRVKTYVVANSFIAVPRDPLIERVTVGSGFDAADDWIAERAGPTDVVLTADIPLAARAVAEGATCLDFRGGEFTADNVGEQLATRDLLMSLRDHGQTIGGPRPFTPRDRGRFAGRLDEVVQRLRRTRG